MNPLPRGRGIEWGWACWLWGRVYRRWMKDGWYVAAVLGWRAARVKNKRGGVEWMQPCFWIFD